MQTWLTYTPFRRTQGLITRVYRVQQELMGMSFISLNNIPYRLYRKCRNLYVAINEFKLKVIQKSKNRLIRVCTLQKSDLIIGTAIGYRPDDIKPFIMSLRATGYNGRLVLFVDNMTSDAASFLREHKIELMYCNRRKDDVMPVHSRRYFEFAKFLGKEQGIKRVMLTDVRDVIFQGNPFSGCCYDSLYVFGEDSSVKLSQCPHNSEWILNLYGNDILKKLGSETIICCGVTIGGYRNILHYLDILCGEMAVIPPIHGADTGAHNLLIRTGRIPDVVTSDNESGSVYTLHHVRPDRIRTDSEGFILNDSGRPAVIHQYDRHPALVEIVKGKYG
jgi:hypothetical protein